MTLGNDPQPLTRRQARERARGQEPQQNAPEKDDPEQNNPEQNNLEQSHPERKATEQQAAEPKESTSVSTSAPRRAGTDSAIQAGETPRFDSSPARVEDAPAAPAPPLATPVSSFAPRSASTKADPAPKGMPMPERTLTRRELRAMKAAEDAETGTQQVIDDDDSAAATHVPDEPTAWNGNRGIDRGSQSESHTQVVDGGQPFDQLISRGVGAGGIPTTSNALILPSVPQQGTRSGPLTSTGEILITGSIDLPRSLGATGQHPNHFDSSEMDHMLDQLDEGTATSSVAPVSASRAVSTHASTRGVMTPPKKSGVSLPSVLAITAAVLAAGVVALFIVGYFLKIF